jgi:hypothetical protein
MSDREMNERDPRILIEVGQTGIAGDQNSDALEKRFNSACDQFNAGDYTIGGWLDDNVTVFSVSSNRPVIGLPAVQAWFKDQFSDHPKFNPLSPVAVTQNVTSKGGVTGTVEGSARWVDYNGAETISFVFTFVLDANRGWLLLTLWGS